MIGIFPLCRYLKLGRHALSVTAYVVSINWACMCSSTHFIVDHTPGHGILTSWPVQNAYSTSLSVFFPLCFIIRSLNALVAQSKNYPLGVNTRIQLKNITTTSDSGARGGTALQLGRSRVRFPMALLEFFIDVILPVALWPWG